MDASLVEVSLASMHQGVLALALQLVYVLSAGGRLVEGLYLRTIKERSVYPSTLGRESRSMAKSLYGRAR